jgi:4-amino-4-deoxy-L-arabinose transferase-like glycosyltransferase
MKRYFTSGIGIILFVGLLLRLVDLNRSVWIDEVWYATRFGIPNWEVLGSHLLLDKSAPFYQITMFFWVRIFGDSEISIRLPSLICGLSSIFLTYRIALESIGRRVALLAGILLALSPVHLWYCREASPYAMVVFLSLLSVYAFEKLRDASAKSHWYYIYGGSLLCAVFTHWFAGAFLIAFSLLGYFTDKKAKWPIIKLNTLIGIVLGCFWLFKLKCGVWPTGDSFLRAFTPLEWWLLFSHWFPFANSLWSKSQPYHLGNILNDPAWCLSQVVVMLIFVRGLMTGLRRRKTFGGLDYLLYVCILPLFLLGLTLRGYSHIYIERYMLIIVPFYCIIIARGATHFKTRAVEVITITVIVAFSVLTLITFFIKDARCQWSVYKPNPGWRMATEYFIGQEQIYNAPGIIFVTSPDEEVTYYSQRLRNAKQPFPDVRIIAAFYLAENGRELQFIEDTLRQHSANIFYVMDNKHWSLPVLARLLKSIDADKRFHLMQVEFFKSLRIFKFYVESNELVV